MGQSLTQALQHPSAPALTPRRVAVIGAGAAGLAAARALRRRGHDVVVFEKGPRLGGIWAFEPDPGDDPLGADPVRPYSALYDSLRTNLPRDLMAFVDYPFDSSGGGDDAWPRFPGHAEVLAYLERFARDFSLLDAIRFDTQVDSITPADGWRVISTRQGRQREEAFDAVAVGNGHYAVPRIPSLPGMGAFPGRVQHSKTYRRPDGFRGQTVAVLGASASGLDLSTEVATVARHVYWCADAFAQLPVEQRVRGNVERTAAVAALLPDGGLRLRNGAELPAVDVLLLCTGYRYAYPFLPSGLVDVDDNWVRPLWQDLLHVRHPTLAFIGIPFRVVPFPLFDVQARWFAALLSGDVTLPEPDTLLAASERRAAELRAAGVAQRHFHQRSLDCYDYLDALCAQSGQPPIPDWHRDLAAAVLAHVAANPGRYRDRPLPTFGPTRVAAGTA